MNMKTTMVLIALIGVGLFALPQTTALFAGQHSFTNIDATGNQIDCVKCHGDVQTELSTQGVSTVTGTNGPHAAFKCEYCHRIEAGSSSGDNAYGTIAYTDSVFGSPTNGAKRTLIVRVMDMEAGNIPINILIGDNATAVKSQPTISGIPMGAFSLSPVLPAVTNTSANATVVLTSAAPDRRLAPTYNPATGLPLDTTATKDTGLDVSKISFTLGTDSRGRPAYLPNFSGAGSRAVNPGSSYHAASLVSCMECHGGDEPTGHYSRVVDGTALNATGAPIVNCENCHYATSTLGTKMTTLWAGGFGLTGRPGDTGSSEAHMELVKTADNMTRYKDGASNGACIACHTHVAVDITYDKPSTYKFDSTFARDPNSNNTVSGFSATGSVISHS